MAKISGLNDKEMDELDAIEDPNKRENLCEGCQHYDVCYSDGGELPNYINCFLDEDDDIFFNSNDEREAHVWKEMSYNKYKEH